GAAEVRGGAAARGRAVTAGGCGAPGKAGDDVFSNGERASSQCRGGGCDRVRAGRGCCANAERTVATVNRRRDVRGQGCRSVAGYKSPGGGARASVGCAVGAGGRATA